MTAVSASPSTPRTLVAIVATALLLYSAGPYMQHHLRHSRRLIKFSFNFNSSLSSFASSSASVNTSLIDHIVHRNTMLAYVPSGNALFHTMGKAASSTVWHSVYTALTNKTWANTRCGNIHNKSRSCWESLVTYPHTLRPNRYPLLHSMLFVPDGARRVALQRDPYQRLLSAFKSKYTCDAEAFRTDVKDRANKVPLLYRHANEPPLRNVSCMSIGEFARLLDAIRRNVGSPGYVDSLRKLDNHIRPQMYFFEHVHYHVVADVSQLSNVTIMEKILHGFPYANTVLNSMRENGAAPKHASGNAQLDIPEKAAVALHLFADLSKQGPLTYPLPNRPLL